MTKRSLGRGLTRNNRMHGIPNALQAMTPALQWTNALLHALTDIHVAIGELSSLLGELPSIDGFSVHSISIEEQAFAVIDSDASSPWFADVLQHDYRDEDCVLAGSWYAPPVSMLAELMNDWRAFAESSTWPPVISAGLLMAQLKMIQPFGDKTEVVARGMMNASVRAWLPQTVLCPSVVASHVPHQYEDQFTQLRQSGDWEGWLMFYLQWTHQAVVEATARAKQVRSNHHHMHQIIERQSVLHKRSATLLPWLQARFATPNQTIHIGDVSRDLKVVYNTAKMLVDHMVELGWLVPTDGRLRNKQYRFMGYGLPEAQVVLESVLSERESELA